MSETSEPQSDGYRLAYPIYLDTAMMTSFLAHLEGGVYMNETVTSSARGAVERSRKLTGKLGFRAWLAEGEAAGERSTSRSDEGSTEVTLERTHTSASLFNLLYEYLSDDGILHQFAGPGDLDGLTPGMIVEIVARYEGNAYEDNIAAAAAFVPYLEEISQAEDITNSVQDAERSRSSNPARRQAENKVNASRPAPVDPEHANQVAGMRVASRMVRESGSSPVRDLVVRTMDGFAVILTVSSEYYDERVKGLLRDGEFRTIGKVTRIRGSQDGVRLSRRSVFGALGGPATQDILNGLPGRRN